MYNQIKYITPKFLKNLLIFFPIFISNINNYNEVLLKLLFGFIIFCLITVVIYITNDYIDYEIDKSNTLKNNNKIKKYFSKAQIICLNFSFLPIIITTILFDLFSIYLVLYIFSFYLYTFKLKYIKFLDLIFLNSFYIFRLLFGCDLIELEVSYWFIIFFSSLFLILSILKRIIQINVNKLNFKNKIISYSFNDYKLLKNFTLLFILINCLVFLLYIYQSELVYLQKFSSKTTFIDFNKNNYLIIFFIYLINMVLLVRKIFYSKINKDIFYYVINDRLIILSLIIILFILLL